MSEQDSRKAVMEEAKRQSQKWWAQMHGKSTEEILARLRQTGGGRPDPMASLTYQGTRFPALDQLANEVVGEQNLIGANRDLVTKQFKSLYPKGVNLGTDSFYPIATPAGYSESDFAAKVLNPNRTGALAEQMARLEAQYPGIARRMTSLGIGRPGNEGWNALMGYLKEPGAPAGVVPYHMGLPAESSALRGATTPARLSPELGTGNGFFAADDPRLYKGLFESTAAHEFGHATQGSMHDFVRGLDERNNPAAAEAGAAYRQLVGRLGGSDAAYISRYADKARLQAGLGPWGQVAGGAASKEPFAELFSVARSPQGVEYAKKGGGSALKEMIGSRTGSGAMKMADSIGELNSVEGKLRNVGFNEVGAVTPKLAMQVGLPALAGLLASKTHGNVRSAMEGAALGSGLGGMAGPTGTLVGGAVGAGAGLLNQLL